MKNKKIAVVVFMLIAVLTIGFGYAALTDILTIKGSAEVTAAGAQGGFDEKVYFTSAEVTEGVKEGSSYIDTASITADHDIVSFSVNSLNSSDDVVVFTYIVSNFSDHNAVITIEDFMAGDDTTENPNATNANFDVEYEIANGGVIARKTGTCEITVTVKLAEGVNPPTSGSMTASFTCELTATTAD